MSENAVNDVLDFVPAVGKYILTGEITLAEYNEWWETIVCLEIARKCGMRLLCKYSFDSETMKQAGGPTFTIWLSGINYLLLSGRKTLKSTTSRAPLWDLKAAAGSFLDKMSVVDALPHGFRKLCARPDMLRPVVLLTLPYWRQLFNKLMDVEFIEFIPLIPGECCLEEIKESQRLRDKLRKFMDKWSPHYWTDKLVMRIPSYVAVSKLRSNGILYKKFSNEVFRIIYEEESGIVCGHFTYSETWGDETENFDDPQRLGRRLLDRMTTDPPIDIKRHDFFKELPKDMLRYLEGKDILIDPHRCPLNFVEGNFYSASPIQSVSLSTHLPDDTIVVGVGNYHSENGPQVFLNPDLYNPSEYSVTVHQNQPSSFDLASHSRDFDQRDRILSTTKSKKDLGPQCILHGDNRSKSKNKNKSILYSPNELLVYNVPEHVKVPNYEQRIVDDIMDLEGSKQKYRFAGRWHAGKSSGLLIVLTGNIPQIPSIAELNRKMSKDPKLNKFKVKQRYQKEALTRPRVVVECRSNRSRERERRRNRDSENSRRTATPIDEPLIVDDEVKAKYSSRIRNFLTVLANSIGMDLVVDKVISGGLVKCQMKLTNIPFMLLGGSGAAVEEGQAESIAHVSLLGKLVEMGLLLDFLVDLISNYEEWTPLIVGAMKSALVFLNFSLEGPQLEPLLREVQMWERCGAKFVDATRDDQIYIRLNFISSLRAFCDQMWKETTILVPDGLNCPQVPDGCPLRVVPSALTLFKNVVNKVKDTKESIRTNSSKLSTNGKTDGIPMSKELKKLMEDEKRLKKEAEDIERQLKMLSRNEGPLRNLSTSRVRRRSRSRIENHRQPSSRSSEKRRRSRSRDSRRFGSPSRSSSYSRHVSSSRLREPRKD